MGLTLGTTLHYKHEVYMLAGKAEAATVDAGRAIPYLVPAERCQANLI